MSDGAEVESIQPPPPERIDVPTFYTRIDPVENSAGQPTDAIATAGTGSVTITGETDATAHPGATPTPDVRLDAVSTLVFVDAGVMRCNPALSRAADHEDVVVLPEGVCGLTAVSRAVREHGRPLSGLTIVAHGAPGRLTIGATTLESGSLVRLAPLLEEIGDGLAETGRVTLISCDVAAGSAGRAFVEALSDCLDRPVSAASHPLGAVLPGGRWDLDVATDGFSAPLPFSARQRAQFVGVLSSVPLLPLVDSITFSDLDLSAGTVDFTVTFSDPAEGFDASNVVLSGLAGATVSGITTTDNTTYTVAVSFGPGTSSGTLKLGVTGAQTGYFSGAVTSYGAGGPYAQAYDLAVGSFAGPGSTDVALVDVGGSEIHIASANGDGSFTALGTYSTVPGNGAVFSHPQSITVGDFNGDGIPDLAVANGAISYFDPYSGSYYGTNGDIAILTGKGDGTFDPATFVSAGDTQFPASIATGDFNGDGIPDLVTADFNQPGTTGDQISVVTGKGDGTFSAPTLYTLKDAPSFVATGDLTGQDGTSDVVISTAAGIAIVRDGDFAHPTYLDIGQTSGKAAIGDLNGDGIPDIVVPTYAGLVILLGVGDSQGKATGTFAAPALITLPQSMSATIADMTGDGVPDLVASIGNGFVLLTGVGDGTFTTGAAYAGRGTDASLAVADVNGDGVPDVILPYYSSEYNDQYSDPVDTYLNGDGPTGSVVIDRTPGTASLSASSDNFFGANPNDVDAGHNVTISVHISKPFTISGPIILQLNNGVRVTGTVASAYGGTPTPPYQAGPDYLKFTYKVKDNDNEDTPDLTVTGFAPGSGTITDSLGNPVSITGDTHLEIDTTAPSVVGIKQVDPAVTSAATVDYIVTFSEAISLAQASILIDPSSTDAGAAVKSVTSTGINVLAPSASYDVQLSTGTGDGTLKFAFGSGITDSAGNPLAPTPVVPAYTIEHASPTITSFTAAAAGPTNAGVIDYNLTFSQAVQGLAASQFQVTTTGAVTGAAVQSVTSTDGIHYTVAVDAGTGNGTIGLALTGGGVTDLAGNPLGKVYSEATVGGATGSVPTLLADVNGDGKKDLVTFDEGHVIVRLGNGNGTFGTPISTALNHGGPVTSLSHVVVGDFNGDGRADIAYVNGDSFGPISLPDGNSVETEGVFILTSLGGNAQGTFAETDLTPTQTHTDTTTETNDGEPISYTSTATSVLGGSDGSSAPITGISAGDVNGDGHTDLILVGPVTTTTVTSIVSSSKSIINPPELEIGSASVVLTNTGTTGTNFVWSGLGRGLVGNTDDGQAVTADLNGDGKSDIITSGSQGQPIVELGRSDGTLGQPIATGLPANTQVVVGDVNGDGIPDLVGLTPGSNGQSTLNVEIGKGDGTFTAGPSTTVASGADFTLADLNGDGKLDVLIGNQLYLGTGTGAFASPVALAISNNGVTPTVADLNGDGVPDLVTLDGASTNPAGLTPAVALSGRPGFTSTDTTIDRTPPTVLSVHISGTGIDASGSGSVGIGATINFDVETTVPVTVTGTPILDLDDGGTATYQSTSGTDLLFTTIVQAGQSSPDLSITGVEANGSTLVDANGNALDLTGAVGSGAIGNPVGTLVVDGVAGPAPAITIAPLFGTNELTAATIKAGGLFTVSGTATHAAGQAVTVTLAAGVNTETFTTAPVPATGPNAGIWSISLPIADLTIFGAGAVMVSASVTASGQLAKVSETLKEDATPIAVQVTTTADSGVGSLRAAILATNAAPGSTITFSPTLNDKTITLASALPAITADGTIIDGGADVPTIDGAGTSSVFSVGDGTHAISATIENLVIENGQSVVMPAPGVDDISVASLASLSLNGVGAVDGSVDNAGLISGRGSISGLVLKNETGGVIDATGAGDDIALETTLATNAGLMEATGGATLIVDTALDNTGGTIKADGGTVTVETGGQITGGTLATVNGGTIGFLSGSSIAGAIDNTGTVDATGQITRVASASYDVGTNTGGSSGAPLPSSPILDPSTVAQGSGALDYYVSFDGVSIDGQSVFKLSSFSLAGSNSGKTALGPVTMTFADSAVEPTLLRFLAAGTHITTAEVYGYTAGTGTVAAAYGFQNMTVGSLDTTNGIVSADLAYSTITDSALTVDATGQITRVASASYDVGTNTGGSSGAPLPSSPILDPSTVAQGSGALDYYVSFDGVSIDGQSVFKLSSFSLAGSNSGKTALGPVTMTFADSAVEPTLLRFLAAGTHITTAEVYGYTAGTGTVAAAYGFQNMTVGSLDTTNGIVSADLAYSTITDSALTVDATGQITRVASASYDVGTNTGGSSGAPLPSSPILDPSTVAQGSGALDYYVSFDGVSIDGQSVFKLSSFSLAGSNSGKTALGPVTMTFADSAVEPTLLRFLAAGTHITTAEVYGYTAGTGTVAAAYGFQNMTVGSLDTTNGIVSADLAYSTITDSALTVDATGQITRVASASYDVGTNTGGSSGAPLPSSPILDPSTVAQGSGALDYYVSFDGVSIDGQSVFKLSSFSLAGSNSGKTALGPVTMTFADSAVEPTLLRFLAAGTHITTAEVYGYTAGTGTVAAAYGFQNMTVGSLDTTNGIVSADLAYSTITDSALTVDATGQITRVASASYDVGTNTGGSSGAPLPSSPILDPSTVAQGSGALDYYVSFDGVSIDGQSVFKLSSFSLAGSNSGKTALGPVTMTFADSAVEPTLLRFLAAGTHITTAEVYGYTAGTGTVAAAYGFQNMTVGSLDTTNGIVSADLAYSAITDSALTVDGGPVVAASGATLSGGGTVELAGPITGATATSLIDNVDNTIIGSGAFANIALKNETGGVIDATGAGDDIALETTSATNAGLMEATGGATLFVDTAIDNSGTIKAAAGSSVQIDGAVNDPPGGQLEIDAGATMTLNGAVDASQTLDFVGTAGTLVLGDASAFAGTIDGLATGATIELTGVGTISQIEVLGGHTLQFDLATGKKIELELDPNQTYAASAFKPVAEAAGVAGFIFEPPPVATPAFGPVPSLTNSTTPTLGGTGEPGSIITLTASTSVLLLGPHPVVGTKTFTLGQVTVGTNGTWSFTVGVTAGSPLLTERSPFGEATVYRFSAVATAPGQIASGTVTSTPLELDITAPAVNLTTASSVDAPPATIAGTIDVDASNPSDDNDAALSVTITDVNTFNGVVTTTTRRTNAVAGAFGIPFVNELGTNVITAQATDAAGNVGTSAPITIEIDPGAAPTITAASASLVTEAEAPIGPFTGVTIGDTNAGATDTLTITIGGAGGVLSGSGLTKVSTGVYTLTGPAETVTSELGLLSFTPNAGAANSQSVSTFQLSDASSAYPVPAVNNAITVTDIDRHGTGGPGTPTLTLRASQAPVDAGGSNAGKSPFGENVSGTIDVADAGDLITIYDTDASGVIRAVGTTTANNTGSYNFTPTLPAGTTNILTASATNSSGSGISNTIDLGVIAFDTSDALALGETIENKIVQDTNSDSDPTKVSFVMGPGDVFPSTPDVIVTAAGADSIIASNLTNLISVGNTYVVQSNSSSANMAFAGGNNTIHTPAGSTDTVVSGSGDDVVFASGNGAFDVGAGTNTVGTALSVGASDSVLAYGTSDVIFAGSGAATISEFGTGALISATGFDLVNDGGKNDTIVASGSAATIFGGQASTDFLGSGSYDFISSSAASGSDTIASVAAGSETVFGGTSDLIFAGQSKLTYIGTGGSATITGGAGSDTVYTQNGSQVTYFGASGAADLIAGAGNSTINGASATAGSNFIATSGSDTIVGGSGNDTFFAGSGHSQFTGNGGANQYVFANGQGGGTVIVTDFKADDLIVLIGYGASTEVSNVLATAKVSGGITSFVLPDNTKVYLVGTPTTNTSNVVGFLVHPHASDGYLQGSTVGYLDTTAPSGVVRVDPNQPTTTTDSQGAFLLTGGSGPIVLTGGTDSATGLAFTGTLEAPAGSTELTPVTTLVEEVVAASGNSSAAGIAAANAAVDTALGIAAGTDLTNLDPEAGTLAGDATATKVFAAGSSLLDITDLISAAGGSSGAALTALASAVASGTTLDLTDAAGLTSIAMAAGLSATAAAAVASVVSTTATALAQQLATAPNATSVFDDITGASIAQQGIASTVLAAAVADGGDIAAAASTYTQDVVSTLDTGISTATHNNIKLPLPAISGTQSDQTTVSEAGVKPFAGVTITDPNIGATDALTITLGGTGGTLSGAGLSGSGRTYTLSGAATVVTGELDALSFTATAGSPGSSSTTTFTLSDTSSAFATPAVDSTTSIIDSDPGLHTTTTTKTLSDGSTQTSTYHNGVLSDVLDTSIPGQAWDTTDTLYGSSGQKSSETFENGGLTIEVETFNTNGSLHDIAYSNVTGEFYVSYDVVYGSNGKAASAIYSNGQTVTWTYNANGTVHDIAYAGVAGQPYVSYDIVYGANGRQSSATYSNGQTATWTYNANGDVHDIAYAGIKGQAYTSEDIVYGANDLASVATYSNGLTATWTYNADGTIHDIAYAGVTGQPYTSYDLLYGANGQSASATYSNGQTAVWTYNANGTVHDIAYAGVTGLAYTSDDTVYGANGLASVATYSNGLTATWTYNANGTIHDIAYANPNGQAFTPYDVLYGANGRAASAIYSNGQTAVWTYNANGTVHDIAYAGVPGQAYTSYDTVYGANGLASVATYSNGLTATWTYNANGTIHDVAYANPNGRAYTPYDVLYGANGQAASASYSNGQTALWTYNINGTLHDFAYAGVTGQAYTSYDVLYGANGQSASATYSNGQTAVWTYNANGTVHDIAYAGVTGQAYTSYDVVYGANGQQASATYSNGQTIDWTYTANSTVHDIAYAGVTGQAYTSYDVVYGANGQQASATYSNGQTVNWTYTNGAVHDIAYAGITGLAYTSYDTVYGVNGQQASATYSNGQTINWTYNANGTVHDIAYAGITGQAYTSYDTVYGANGQPASATYSNGQTTIWTYNANGTVHDVAYAGITGQVYTAYDVIYGINGLSASALYSDGETAVWTYNANGTLHDIAYAGVDGQAYTSYDVIYGANGLQALATYSNGQTTTWTYNANGTVHDAAYAGITGHTYKSYDALYGANGKPASSIYSNGQAQVWTWNTDGSYELQTTGIAGQTYDATDAFYSSAGKIESEIFTKNGVSATLENWNANGSVANNIDLSGANTPSKPFGGQASIDVFAFDAAKTTLGFQEDASNTFGTLTITSAAEHAALVLFGQYAASGFGLTQDGHGGSLISYLPPSQPLLVPAHV